MLGKLKEKTEDIPPSAWRFLLFFTFFNISNPKGCFAVGNGE
jgi:hypothetical protein